MSSVDANGDCTVVLTNRDDFFDRLTVKCSMTDGTDGILSPDKFHLTTCYKSWLRVSAVERRSLAGEISLSCARPVADG